MTKYSSVLFLCLLAIALLSVSECVGSSFMQGRQLAREPRVLFSNQHDELHKIQVRKMRIKQGRPTAAEVSRHEEGLEEELVYHIDYHGVTTHPTPTPKHPAP